MATGGRESAEGETGEGKRGQGAGDGDGRGGPERDKGPIPVTTFVFGSGGGSVEKGRTPGEGTAASNRRTGSWSYKEKLLSLGCGGFLNAEKDPEKENSEEDESDVNIANGKYPVLSVTAEQYSAWCQPWMNSLIIKLLGAHVPKHILIDRVRRMWKPQQPLKVTPLSNEYYIVSFTSKEDRDYAFQEGPWMIDDHYLLVQKWRPNFNPWKADTQQRIAAWIHIPDLPMEFYNMESLRMIGNMVGKTIKVDRSTSIYDKGSFARICVEIDLQKLLLPAFTVWGEDRQIVYEGLHQVCFCCGKYGHQQQACPSNLQDKIGDVATRGTVPRPDITKESAETCDVKEQELINEGGQIQIPMKEGSPTPSNGCLGPQMLVKRDFRRGVNLIEKKVGSDLGNLTRNQSRIKKQDMVKSVANQMGSQKDTAERTGSRKSLRHNFGKDIGNSTATWIRVGSKRKNDAKCKRGKENKNSDTVCVSQDPSISTNPFSILQHVPLMGQMDMGPIYVGGSQGTTCMDIMHNNGTSHEDTLATPSDDPLVAEPTYSSLLDIVQARDVNDVPNFENVSL
ncbi:uncharacterized protein LOC114759711 [Neltuma alba]|uniref:uncharacterized protein LOC114759711 n=1 Tax=Neltuma alba TaxID=207710 RepID=UPI0010A532D7|nr:uncharacterized protein LOC114759711 [Prosopis alba]